MMKKTMTMAAGIALLGVFAAAAADDAPARPTFNRDVLPILQQNCQDCHRPEGKNMGGMVAPMALISYDEVRPPQSARYPILAAGWEGGLHA